MMRAYIGRMACMGQAVRPSKRTPMAFVRRVSNVTLTSHDDITRQHQIRSSLESIIFDFSNKPLPEISMNDLLKFNTATKHNKELMILQNANETVLDLFTLIAKRLKVFRQLPYIAVLNPNIAEIYDTYLETLKVLLEFVTEVQGGESSIDDIGSFKIATLEQNERLIKALQRTIDIHTDNLTVLSKGFEEIAPLNLFDGGRFLDNHLKERIMMRLVANHHMLLSSQLKPLSNSDIDSGILTSIGVVDKKLDVMKVIGESIDFVNGMCLLKYDERVRVKTETFIIRSDATTKYTSYEPQLQLENIEPVYFPFIPSHLEYVLNEVFKNSARALIESKRVDPIEITVVAKDYQNLKEEEHLDTVLEIRISDRGGGIPPEAMERLFEYSFTTFDSEEAGDSYKTLNNVGGNAAVNIIAGMGYGLPLSRIYVELFGGDLDVQTIHGHGTDVYIRLRGPDASLLK